MTTGSEVLKSGPRRVRTPEGARFFHLPIGAIITRASIAAAVERHGNDRTLAAMKDEQNFRTELPSKPFVPSNADSMAADLLHDVGNLIALARFEGRNVSKSSAHPIDGDGDGWVLDGTPEKRPATPSEMAAGAKWRASRGKTTSQAGTAIHAATQPAQAKMKFATNEYDARIDLYHKAIDQAVHSKDPRLVAKVTGLINEDKSLKDEDRTDLHGVLSARRDGQMDPRPTKGSNRSKRAGFTGRLRQVGDAIQGKRVLSYEVPEPKKPKKPRKAAPKKAPEAKKPVRTEGTDPNALAREQVQRNKPKPKPEPEDVNLGGGGAEKTPKSEVQKPDVAAGDHKVDLKTLRGTPKKRAAFDPNVGFDGPSEESPAGKALEDGTRIEDLKDTTGLLAYLADNPDQFELKEPRIPGHSAETLNVKDKDNGRLYFFKLTANNADAHAYGDGINEVMTSQIGNAAIPDMFPNVDFVGAPEHNQSFAVRADHVTQFAKDHGIDVKSTAFTVNGFNAEKAADGEDKKMLGLHIFDYLANITDRHDAGMSIVTDKKGKQHVIPFDNGSAFHSYDTFLTEHLGFPKEFADAPETIDYPTWLGLMTDSKKGGKGVFAHHMAQTLYNGDEDQLRKDSQEILKKYQGVSLDSMIADLRKRFPDLSAYEDAHLEGMARIWKSRLGQVTADDIVKGML